MIRGATATELSVNVDVLVMEASILGGMLFSESVQVPTVTFGSTHNFEFAIEDAPTGQPSWSLRRYLRQRIHSFGLTPSFM